ncbi:BC_2427 family protein [Aeribacillus sp. FSL M8-0254]|uniref:BC_2427 family protein n=1 Tax=Aeribacillus sp. FSL M8-0254 TaxID=2954577 RepID=UPI0030FC9A28
MKTPWIHHERMQQIRSKQMNIFKSSRVQKKSVCANFQHTKEENDSHKSDIVANRIDTAEADDSHENYGIKKVTKLNKNKNNVSKLMNLYKKYNMSKRNHTGSICGPTQPSNRTTDPEHVSSTDDHTLKTDDSHIKQISLPSLGHETKDQSPTDSIFEPIHISSNSDEINDQEDDFDTDPIDHSVDRAHLSSDGNDSELMPLANADHDLKTDYSSHDVKQISLPSLGHETKDQSPTDSIFEPIHISSNSDEINDQEDDFDTDPIDHSVDRAHLSSDGNDSELMPLANADHDLKTDYSSHDVKQISLPSLGHETKDQSPTDSIFEPIHTSSNSDEINDQEDDFDTDPIDHSVDRAHSSSDGNDSELMPLANADHDLKTDCSSHDIKQISLPSPSHETKDHPSADSVLEPVHTSSNSDEIDDQEDAFDTDPIDHSVDRAHSSSDGNDSELVLFASNDHTLKMDGFSHVRRISLTDFEHHEKYDQDSMDSVFELVYTFASSSNEINDQEDHFETNSFDYSVELAHLLDENNLKQVFPAVDEYAVNTDVASHADLEQETNNQSTTNSVFEFAHDSSSSDKINDQENISETNPIDYTVEPVHSLDDAVPEQSPSAVDEHAVNTDVASHADLEQETNNQSTTNSVFEFAHDSSSSDKINDQENISETNPIDYTVEPVHLSDGADPEQSPSAVDEHAVKTDEYSHADLEQDKKDHPADSAFEPAHASSSSDEMNDQDVFKINFINHTVELTRPLDIADSEQVPTTDVVRASKMDETPHAAGLEQDIKDHALTDSVFEPVPASSGPDEINDQENIHETNFIDHKVEPDHSSYGVVPEEISSADVEHTVKTDEVSHAEQETVSVFEPVHPSSESDGTNDQKAINFDNADESIKYGKTCSMTIKRPFSTFVEIDDFLHSPIFSSIVQNSAEFLDLNNKQTPQLNTKLLNTTTYYPEQPDCRLVCSKIHEMISLTDTVSSYSKNNKNNHYQSIAVPLHDSKAAKTSETDNKTCTSHDFIQIRVPVVAGEYKMEIILEEDVVFEEEILGVKEISKEVVLTNCKFVPTQFSPSLDNGTCTALKGNLFIKGYISQNIEYTAADNGNEGSKQNESVPYYRQLHQKIILDLIVHLLQVQQVRVSYASNGI